MMLLNPVTFKISILTSYMYEAQSPLNKHAICHMMDCYKSHKGVCMYEVQCPLNITQCHMMDYLQRRGVYIAMKFKVGN